MHDVNAHERIYRSLLILYPEAHRREYGEPMVQLMRDRFRDEGGGMGTVRLWGQIAGDLVRTALSERTEMTMDSFKQGWWRLAAGLISVSIVALAIANLFVEWTGDGSAKFAMATAAILGALVVFSGLATRKRNPARSSVMIGIGLLPTVMLMSVFWSAPLVATGTLALVIALIAFVNAMIERPGKTSLGPAQRP
ncbi:MAG TPA: hypothetical protein VI193_10335 [Acidimicrobiia bacterium]